MTDGEAREMARELVRGSIIEDAASQFIAQILKHAHDERVKPLRKQVAALEAKLAQAMEMALEECPFRWGTPNYDNWWRDRRATIAEIKGESHE